jgi:hypothetical protein
MTDNVLQTLQQLVQDVIAPDVRELKVRLGGFERLVDERFKQVHDRFKQVDDRFQQVDERFNSLSRQMDERFEAAARQSEMQFKTLLATIGEWRAQDELARVREISELRERIAVVESKLATRPS